MRQAFTAALRCPSCRTASSLRLTVEEADDSEVRQGRLRCDVCAHEAAIEAGIVDLLHRPPAFVVKEAAGLARFAEVMRADGWSREAILRLPYVPEGYWHNQAVLMEQVLDTVPMQAGQTLLDLGANTCWASATFAGRGLDVTALDICAHELQGLRTAEWHFEARDIFFERVLGVMFDLPFADASFDFVWACEVLHHNDRAHLRDTFREAFRVLRPGGTLIVCNETLRALLEPRVRPGHDVAEFEGHEHAFLRSSYTRAARAAGFVVEVRGPRYHGIFLPGAFGISESQTDGQIVRLAAAAMIRRRPRLGRAILAFRAYVTGDTALHMVCVKPS